ncbi:hypothetical protein F5Y10DRAFT_269903 [Nemania abortiva]|nr:hypothetical protein F5Y10DRAFT_269903 [Nemania abortiva]
MGPSDDLADYTPEVKTVAPDVPIRSFFSVADVSAEESKSLGINLGYDPIKLQENESQKSGAPYMVRTAVLFRRQRGDNGQFRAKFRTNVHVSWVHDAKESLRNALGSRDDPIYFDPAPAEETNLGAAVLYGVKGRDVMKMNSPCDQNNLGMEDLTGFLIKDDDKDWRMEAKES